MVKKVAQCDSLVASTPRVGPIELPDPWVQAIDNKIVVMTDMIKILRRQWENLTGQKQKSTIKNSAEYKYNVMLVRQEIENELLAKVKPASDAELEKIEQAENFFMWRTILENSNPTPPASVKNTYWEISYRDIQMTDKPENDVMPPRIYEWQWTGT